MSAPRWLPVVIWAAFVLTITSVPNPTVPHIPGGDKIVHAIMYGVLAVLAHHAWPPRSRPFGARLLMLLAIAVMAAADEWHQQFIPGRSAEIEDWLADTAGATVALAFSSLVMALRRRESR
ncbi:MAG: VanZ family protein [Gemmatimonadaceae bacterium]